MGITYRGNHSDAFGLAVKTNPSLLPDFSLITQGVPNRDGAYFIKSKYGMRPIPLEIGFVANNLSDYLSRFRALAEWLRPDLGEGELVDDNEPDKKYYAVLSEQSIKRLDNIAKAGQGQLTLICPKPYAYGEKITQTLDQNNSLVTLFASQSSPYAMNLSPVDAQPKFTVTFSGAATEYKITHQESGKYIRVIYNFSASDILEIDVSKRKISVNGAVNRTIFDWSGSRWFNLQPGNNNFTIDQVSVAETKITYSPRWL
ncbi:putative phage tail component-like protein [Scopulibacillus darangshiensis]|uniref:Putative phage tail component-like protein n=1 Tax=Scopulibacillus darangshiensis TaxID=442528 RepID=A0A4R2PAS6_9BACL|nr:distal tail protein Dit [Scopulibacillus darangshiensis]TCP32189.1 putative phage tail component-like protein [Scopulibacillus darangshiensis]